MPMSESKRAIENILDKEAKRLFESEDAPEKDYKLTEKVNPFKYFKYGREK